MDMISLSYDIDKAFFTPKLNDALFRYPLSRVTKYAQTH